MAARVTLINKKDPSVRRTMLAVDAKELLAVDAAGEWSLHDFEAEERVRKAAEAATNVAAELTAKEEKRQVAAAANVASTVKAKKIEKVDPLA